MATYSPPQMAEYKAGYLQPLEPLPMLQPINPVDNSGGNSGGGGYSGGGYSAPAAPAIDYKALAEYDQAIKNVSAGIPRLTSQLNSGYSQIDSSYENALSQLLLSKNRANETYDTNKLQTGQDFVGAKNTIGANAGSSLYGLQRLLGSRGAGGSSAYNISAPGAVARGASLQRNEAGSTFGRNNQSLDTNWNNFLTDYKNQVSGARTQKDTQHGELKRQIDSSKAGLLQTLAELQAQRASAAGGNSVKAAAPYLSKANSLLDSASRYRVKPISYESKAYDIPSLDKYTFDPVKPTYQGQAPQNDYFSPYFAALTGQKKQQTAGA